MNKICSKCYKQKSVSEFHKKSKSKDGLQSVCKKCNISINKKVYSSKTESEKQELVKLEEIKTQDLVSIISWFKAENCCYYCQEQESCCLEFHHIDPTNKENEIGYLARSKSSNKILLEIQKCIIVCANCHKKIHNNLIKINDLPNYNYSLLTIKIKEYQNRYKKKKNNKKCLDCDKIIDKRATRCKPCGYTYLSKLHKMRGTKPPTRTKT